MQLNADLGESYGAWTMGDDAAIMPFIDQANVACGYHAGDALVMKRTLAHAKKAKVQIGAHLAYPDLLGFGRRSMQLSFDELVATVHAQIAVLEGLAKCENMQLSHIKPHGAMYNDMMKTPDLFAQIVEAVSSYHTVYPLVVQALPNNDVQKQVAAKHHLPLLFEAFADRAYEQDGTLVSRSKPNAVLNAEQALQQVSLLLTQHCVLSPNGESVPIHADTLCVHSDTREALQLCREIRQQLL